MRSPLHSKFFVPLLTGLLFLLLFPVLDIFTHPFSVMHGQYIPLVIRLSDFYWRTWVLGTALFGVPLLLVALLMLAQSRRFGLLRSVLLVVAPFALALFFQYFIAVQLDKYLVDFPAAGLAIPWEHVFQFPFIVWCLELLPIYVSIAAVLWLIILFLRRVVTFALPSAPANRWPAHKFLFDMKQLSILAKLAPACVGLSLSR